MRDTRIIIIFRDECIVEGWTKYYLSKKGEGRRGSRLHRGGGICERMSRKHQFENVLLSFRVALSSSWASAQPIGLLLYLGSLWSLLGTEKFFGSKSELVFFWCWLGLLFLVVGDLVQQDTWSDCTSLFEVWVLKIDVFQLIRKLCLPFGEVPEWISETELFATFTSYHPRQHGVFKGI